RATTSTEAAARCFDQIMGVRPESSGVHALSRGHIRPGTFESARDHLSTFTSLALSLTELLPRPVDSRAGAAPAVRCVGGRAAIGASTVARHVRAERRARPVPPSGP